MECGIIYIECNDIMSWHWRRFARSSYSIAERCESIHKKQTLWMEIMETIVEFPNMWNSVRKRMPKAALQSVSFFKQRFSIAGMFNNEKNAFEATFECTFRRNYTVQYKCVCLLNVVSNHRMVLQTLGILLHPFLLANRSLKLMFLF